MANTKTNFVTQRKGPFGSSLYYVTSHWIIRCSGNSAEGREPTTFIRKREIKYVVGGHMYDIPTVGSHPLEGEHHGNEIVVILDRISSSNPPSEWAATNGVAWQVAVDEIDAAIEYASHHQEPRASRKVGAKFFSSD